ncbi:ATP-binding protein [Lachnotalea glycerini]|uniref:ATP-binding protein n=1 Tax=Lachnotalea glycerini TaxID=1763509 RepID=A0A371JHK8_9FIRM|nr:ATP-binding protein [Lachnotalea glycerini]RDY32225.1 ATP-binding protein [Lachnotalea glycerini]
MNFVQYAIRGCTVLIVETIIYWIFFNGVFERKKKEWRNVLILLIYPACLLMASYCGKLGMPLTIKLILLIIFSAIITKLIFRASWKNIIIYQGIFTLCSLIGDSLSIGILSVSHGAIYVNELLNSFTLALQATILSKTINIVIVSAFVIKMGKETNRYSFSEMLILMLQGISGIACLTMVMEFSYYKMSTYKVSSVYLIVVSILILASYIVFYNVFDSYIKKRNIEQEATKVQFYNQGQFEYYAALEKENVNVRKMYHDIKNHLLAIQGLNHENAEASQTYVEECLATVEGYDEFFDTGNELADIIFYEKCNTAKLNHIKTKVLVQKNSLNELEMLDLCAILTNSFDNAMEACKKCQGERYIKVNIIRNEAAIIITVKNNFEIEPAISKKGDLITSKKNKAEHGLGMQSLKMAAAKYNGNVEFSVDKEKKEFLLIIMLPIAYQNTL